MSSCCTTDFERVVKSRGERSRQSSNYRCQADYFVKKSPVFMRGRKVVLEIRRNAFARIVSRSMEERGMENDNTVSKYDRTRGSFQGVAQFAKPTTVKHVLPVTGYSTTFIVEVARHDELGTYCFIESLDGDNVVKLVLPPKVVAAITRQQDALVTRARREAGKVRAEADRLAGRKPGFMRAKEAK